MNINKKGFTIVEIMIVIIVIGILATISMPIYRNYVRRSISSEAEALVNMIAQAERIYYMENGNYLPVGSSSAKVSSNSELGVDSTMNAYFRSFYIARSGSGSTATFTAVTTGSGDGNGIVVTLTERHRTPPTVTTTGL